MTSSTTDVIIIGAGIAGVGLAAMLSGKASVRLLERESAAGYHSTGRSAALYFETYGNDIVQQMNRLTAPFLHAPDIDEIDGSILSYRGALRVAQKGEESAFEKIVAAEPDLIQKTPGEAKGLFPILREDGMIGALLDENALDIDTDKLHQGWMRHARNKGCDLVLNADVEAIERDGDGWHVITSNGSYHAAIIVNAAGAWADEIAKLAGVAPLGLQPMRRSIAMLKPGDHNPRRWPLAVNLAEDWYAKPQGERLLVSPAEEDPVPPMDAYVDDEVLAGGLHRFEQAMTIPVTRPESEWAGLRTFAPDRTPINGFDPEIEGFFWLAGQGGYGFQTSVAMSRHASALICRRAVEDESLVDALSPSRFS